MTWTPLVKPQASARLRVLRVVHVLRCVSPGKQPHLRLGHPRGAEDANHAELAVVARLRDHLPATHTADAFRQTLAPHGSDLFQQRFTQDEQLRA